VRERAEARAQLVADPVDPGRVVEQRDDGRGLGAEQLLVGRVRPLG
jgi:hypothetical protein